MFRNTIFCLLLLSCSSPAKEAAKPSPFYFPDKPPQMNWCKVQSPEAVALFPDGTDGHKRYFLLKPGIFRFLAKQGNATASCMLTVDDSGRVGVYTADLLPECMSRRNRFSLDEAEQLHYQGEKYIAYTLSIAPTSYGPAIFVQDRGTLQTGFNVYRCADCR